MEFIVRNTTNDDILISEFGQIIPANSSFDLLTSYPVYLILTSVEINNLLRNGTLVRVKGGSDIPYDHAYDDIRIDPFGSADQSITSSLIDSVCDLLGSEASVLDARIDSLALDLTSLAMELDVVESVSNKALSLARSVDLSMAVDLSEASSELRIEISEVESIAQRAASLAIEAVEASDISEASSIAIRALSIAKDSNESITTLESELDITTSIARLADSIADRGESLTRAFDSLARYRDSVADSSIAKLKSISEFAFHVSSSPPSNPVTGQRWYNTSNKLWFTYDGDKFVSDEVEVVIFSRPGNCDGVYLNCGSVNNPMSGLLLPMKALLVRITAKASGGYANKSFSLVKDNSSVVFSFNLDNLSYINNSPGNIVISEGSYLQCFCSSDGSAVQNPVVNVLLKWIYP